MLMIRTVHVAFLQFSRKPADRDGSCLLGPGLPGPFKFTQVQHANCLLFVGAANTSRKLLETGSSGSSPLPTDASPSPSVDNSAECEAYLFTSYLDKSGIKAPDGVSHDLASGKCSHCVCHAFLPSSSVLL